MADDEESPEGKGGEEESGSTPERRPSRIPTGRRRMLLVILLGVVLVLAALAVAYVKIPSGSSGTPPTPAPVDCGLGSFPATQSSPELSLAAAASSYPSPANGSSSPEGFSLWINTTGEALPGTEATFAVQPLEGALNGVPAGPACKLPVPISAWTSTPPNATLEPETSRSVAFLGTPSAPYGRAGVFGVQIWVNTTSGSGTTVLGAIHTELVVGADAAG